MDFFENTTVLIVLVLILLMFVIVLLMVTVNLSMTVSRLKKKYRLFMKGMDGASLERAFSQKFKQVDFLEKQIIKDQAVIDALKAKQDVTLNQYGIVKYDAFDDVGGKMSFALANIDKNNNGYILNAIHSRDNCFLYLKEIVGGESYVMLSEEEVEALKRAVGNGLDVTP